MYSFVEAEHIPLIHGSIVGYISVGDPVDDLVDHILYAVAEVFSHKHSFSLAVNDLTLFVHYLVVLKKAFTNGEVVALHLLLGALDGLCEHSMLNGLILADTHFLDHFLCLIRAEKAHKIVLHRDEES